MKKIAIIGGTGLSRIDGVKIVGEREVETLYGPPSAPITIGTLGESEIYFLPRHGSQHTIPPHRVNYRANIHALKSFGIDSVIGVNAVGGITAEMAPRVITLPDQLIDYTWGRESTFFSDNLDEVTHIEFADPYDSKLRQRLVDAGEEAGVNLIGSGTYGVTQGPRLETKAEIRRLQKDGCDIVGMTALPEAALAREAGMAYATLAVVANWAAGKSDEEITMAIIESHISAAMAQVLQLLESFLSNRQ